MFTARARMAKKSRSKGCPACGSGNVVHIDERDETICRDCGTVSEPLDPTKVEWFEESTPKTTFKLAPELNLFEAKPVLEKKITKSTKQKTIKKGVAKKKVRKVKKKKAAKLVKKKVVKKVTKKKIAKKVSKPAKKSSFGNFAKKARHALGLRRRH